MSQTAEHLDTGLKQGWPVPKTREYESTRGVRGDEEGPSPTVVVVRLVQTHITVTGLPLLQRDAPARRDDERSYAELHRASTDLGGRSQSETPPEVADRDEVAETLSRLQTEGIATLDDD